MRGKFSERRHGEIATLAEVADRIMHGHANASALHFNGQRVFTWTDIARLLSRLNKWSVAGEDRIPSRLLRQNRLAVAKHLVPLFMKCTMFMVEPCIGTGERLKDHFKGGDSLDKDAYRSRIISSHVAKTYHRGYLSN